EFAERRVVLQQFGNQHVARDRGIFLSVELQDELLDQVAGGHVRHLVDDPASLAANPTAAHMKHLHGSSKLVRSEGNDVGVGAILEDDGLLLHRAAQGVEVVTQPGRALELESAARLVHLSLQTTDHRVGLASHEVAEVIDNLAMLFRRYPSDAGSAALTDVATKTRATHLT